MFTFILFILSSLALNSAQLNTGPQTFIDQSSYDNIKHSINNQYSFYVPLQLNPQNENIKNEANQGNQDLENQQRTYSRFNFVPIQESQEQNREQSENSSKKDESVYREEGLKLINSYSEQKRQEQDQLVSFEQGSDLQNVFLKSIPKTLYSNKNKEQRNLGEELQEKWSRILGNNRVNLKSLSLSDDLLKVQTEKPIEQTESNNKGEQRTTETGNVIQYVLRNHGNNDFVKVNVFGDELNSQITPLVIQEQSPTPSNNDKLKALSGISESQFFNFGQPEQTNFREEGQRNSEVGKQIEDIRNSGNIRFGTTKDFGIRQFNYQPAFNQGNQGELKEKSIKEEQENAEIRKLIEEIVKNNNNFGKLNFRSEETNQGSFFKGQSDNRVHLKALSTISEDNQFSKPYFGNRS